MAVALLATNLSLIRAHDYQSWPVPVGPICEMTTTPTHTYFNLWSPKARAVVVNIYEDGQSPKRTLSPDGTPLTAALKKHPTNGTWSTAIPLNLEGRFYTFTVTDEKGKKHEETPGIFAKAVGVNGQRAQIIDLRTTNPEGWDKDTRPSLAHYSDAVIYEMHHRDFSIHPESGITHKGKYLALTETGTPSPQGDKTGIDRLRELGVTHVPLLPSYDYGSVDETRLDQPQYNWGYDPVNYNAPEGSYSTDPYDPAVRIKEFKQMVMALHKAGIRVVMDVVYNHVFDLASSNFEKTAPGYFFRWNQDGTPANGSGCGNETASERPMMRKYMVESVLYWAREYHIDGFRFDLMGIHDIETMNAIREAVNAIDPTILIYGEGWAASTPRLEADQLAMKANTSQLQGIAAFGDEMRDGLRGGWDDDKKGAFLIGLPGHEESIKFGIAGATPRKDVDIKKVNYSKAPWANSPEQMISYVSCHDDMCLADRIKATAPKADKAERIRLQKLAYTAVMTSQGIPFVWCGDEVMRDRKGVHNCYKSPDDINAIPWGQKAEYRDVFDYISGLIHLRQSTRLHEGTLTFLPVKGKCVVAYQFTRSDATYIVVLNSNRKTITQAIPEGQWIALCRDGVINPEGIGTFKGKTVKVPAQSAIIIKK